MHHRIWHCSAVDELRHQLAPAWLIHNARKAGPKSLFYNRGWAVHPAEAGWPKPSKTLRARYQKWVPEAGLASCLEGVSGQEGLSSMVGSGLSASTIEASCSFMCRSMML